EVIRSHTTIKGKLIDGIPHIDIRVRSELNVAEVQCSLDLTKSETISEIEAAANARVNDFIERTVKTVQNKYKVDIFGFGEAIRRADPKAWRTLKDHWNETFQQAVIHVRAENKIRRLGTVNNSFIEEMEKANHMK
ncbi:MAG: spore gernimation protein GerC, partial [Paenibacillus sp.]|nr:spore gernimation protein GerC [Paenibacillus sp.]